MQLFYAPDIQLTSQLSEDESGHCVRVLRLKERDEILVTDGKGTFYEALITHAHPKCCTLAIRKSWKQAPL